MRTKLIANVPTVEKVIGLVSNVRNPQVEPQPEHSTTNATPPNFRVCAPQNVPAKCFKICHILYMRKPKVAFSVFHLGPLYIFP